MTSMELNIYLIFKISAFNHILLYLYNLPKLFEVFSGFWQCFQLGKYFFQSTGYFAFWLPFTNYKITQGRIPVRWVAPAWANRMWLNSHQMSALGVGAFRWTSFNRSPVLTTRCHYWVALYSEVPCRRGGGGRRWGLGEVSLYSEVSCPGGARAGAAQWGPTYHG